MDNQINQITQNTILQDNSINAQQVQIQHYLNEGPFSGQVNGIIYNWTIGQFNKSQNNQDSDEEMCIDPKWLQYWIENIYPYFSNLLFNNRLNQFTISGFLYQYSGRNTISSNDEVLSYNQLTQNNIIMNTHAIYENSQTSNNKYQTLGQILSEFSAYPQNIILLASNYIYYGSVSLSNQLLSQSQSDIRYEERSQLNFDIQSYLNSSNQSKSFYDTYYLQIANLDTQNQSLGYKTQTQNDSRYILQSNTHVIYDNQVSQFTSTSFYIKQPTGKTTISNTDELISITQLQNQNILFAGNQVIQYQPSTVLSNQYDLINQYLADQRYLLTTNTNIMYKNALNIMTSTNTIRYDSSTTWSDVYTLVTQKWVQDNTQSNFVAQGSPKYIGGKDVNNNIYTQESLSTAYIYFLNATNNGTSGIQLMGFDVSGNQYVYCFSDRFIFQNAKQGYSTTWAFNQNPTNQLNLYYNTESDPCLQIQSGSSYGNIFYWKYNQLYNFPPSISASFWYIKCDLQDNSSTYTRYTWSVYKASDNSFKDIICRLFCSQNTTNPSYYWYAKYFVCDNLLQNMDLQNSYKLVNVVDPTGAQDVSTKNYTDNTASSYASTAQTNAQNNRDIYSGNHSVGGSGSMNNYSTTSSNQLTYLCQNVISLYKNTFYVYNKITGTSSSFASYSTFGQVYWNNSTNSFNEFIQFIITTSSSIISSVYIQNLVVQYVVSTRQSKQNIQYIETQQQKDEIIDIIQKLKICKYQYKNDSQYSLGIILDDYIVDGVIQNNMDVNNGYGIIRQTINDSYGLNVNSLIFGLIQSVQEQKKINDSQQMQITAQAQQIVDLQTRLQNIEKILGIKI